MAILYEKCKFHRHHLPGFYTSNWAEAFLFELKHKTFKTYCLFYDNLAKYTE